VALPSTARLLLLWALQLVDDRDGLAAARGPLDAEHATDAELRMVLADLDVRRSLPDAVAEALRVYGTLTGGQREPAQQAEEARVLERARRGYERVLAIDPGAVEAQLRLARVQLRLGRAADAAARLRPLAGRLTDDRQAYLAALFLADAEERLGHRAQALQQYEAARRAWPTAQTPAVSLARLHALGGAHAEARAALATLAPAAPGRMSDPWHGFENGQAWRLPDAMIALQAILEPL
jgi:hypothetical protein